MKLTLIILSTILISSCAGKNSDSKYIERQQVSMIQLIANPEKYDGKKVSLTGFFIIAREENVLYLHKADYDNAITKNGIWLSVSEEFMKSQHIEPPYNGYISIEGVFLKNKSKPNSWFSGTLTNISYMYKLEGRGNVSD